MPGHDVHGLCMLTFFFVSWAWQDFYSEMASDAEYVRQRRQELRQLHKMKADDKRVPCLCISGLAQYMLYIYIKYVYCNMSYVILCMYINI